MFCVIKRGAMLWVSLSLAGAAGCATVPRRDPGIAARFPARPAADRAIRTEAIPSVYQEAADRAQAESTPDAPRHYVQLLDIGDDALLARVHLIRAARQSVDIQTFIWRDDAVTRALFHELLSAADRGVRVRLLIDALNPIGPPGLMARMAAAHERIEICLFNPVSASARMNRLGLIESILFHMPTLNRRMHGKLFLVDRRIGIVGGRNYEGKYFDRHPEFLFKDREAAVMGPATDDMARSFDEFWTHRRSVFLAQFRDVRDAWPDGEESTFPPLTAADRAVLNPLLRAASARNPFERRNGPDLRPAAAVSFWSDGPSRMSGVMEGGMTEAYRGLVRGARDRLVFQTPYLIYDTRQSRDLKHARKEAPDLRVIVSGNSLAAADHLHVYALSFKHRKLLYREKGLDMYEFRPVPRDVLRFVPRYRLAAASLSEPAGGEEGAEAVETENADDWVPIVGGAPRLCIHAKTLVVDGQSALIGSHNFDPRSFRLNSENGVLIADAGVAADVEASILRDIEPGNSWVVGRNHWPKTVFGRLGRNLGGLSMRLPLFDLWPNAYTSVFELREGREPLPPRHPDFHLNYRDLGPFPEVDHSSPIIRTRLIKAFGGWARPLM
jgi:cardiolipin synthase C